MLILKNLRAGYGDKTIINIEALTVAKGEKCLISGNSGSGKTTLLYALAGLGEIKSGSVTVDDIDLYALDGPARDHFRGHSIGIVFQTLHLVKSLTVLENILLGSFVKGDPQNVPYAIYLLERLGISPLKDFSAIAVSQGQAQRVAIARALLNKPKLLLADEPTSSLDDHAASQVMDLLQNLAQETQSTLVVSSHDQRINGYFDQELFLGEAV